jgi:60 kDa SS-A/Ro ribonucleoprotein
MNPNIFKTQSASKLVPNDAGGMAYAFSSEHALAQLVVTGCVADTYYTTAEEQSG